MSNNNLTNKQCKYCGKFFRWTSSLKLHLRIHTNERPFLCSKCDKTFTQKIHLQRHSPVHRPGHIVRAYSRNYENKPDMSASAAGDDRVSPFGNSTDGAPTTTNTEDIRCQECDTTFDRWLDLLQHTSEAHPRLEDQQDVNETCEDDDNEPTVEDLDGGESRLRTTWCHICKKHLATVSSRNLHMRIHTGERPFACNVCGKSFTQNVHLRSHMSVHTGAKPYLCKICNKGFVAGRTLKIHMMSHTREQPHTCQWCSRKFLVRQHLITHVHIHHADMVRTSAQDDDDEGDEEESPPTMVATSQVSDGVVRNSSATLRLTSPKRRHLSGVASSALVRSKRKASSSSLHKSRKQRAIDIHHSNVARRLQSLSRQQVFDEGEDEDTELADIITSMDTGDIKTEASTTAETEEQNYWENDTNAGDTMKIDASFSELFQSPKTSKPLDVIVEEKPRPTVTLKTSRRKCASTSRAVRLEQHQQQQHGNSSSNNRSFPSTSSSIREASSSRTNANNAASTSSTSSASSSFQLVNVHGSKVGPSNGHNNNVNNNNNGSVSSQNNTFHQHHHHQQQQQQQQQHNSSANSSSSASNRNRHNESGGIGVVGSSMQQCPNCMLVEGELQLLKTELAMIKQFLGNKLTLMEQKIDNMTTMIRQ